MRGNYQRIGDCGRKRKKRKQAGRGEGKSPADRESLISPALRLFALEYALAELWKSWGIVPAAVLGHGVGQYAAACTAGVFSLEDGLKFVAARGRLVATLPGDGRMLAVMAGPARVADALGAIGQSPIPDLAIAAMNSPRQTVVSGRAEAIERLASELGKQRIRTRLLPVFARRPLAGTGTVCRRVRPRL